MGRVRETLHDVLRQTDAVLLALCVASTLYGMVLIASATSFRGTLKYVAVQGLGLLIGLALYFFLSSIDIFELAKQWKWLLGFNVGFLLLLLTPFGQSSGGNRAWLGVNSIGKKLGVDFLRYFPITVQPAEVVKVFFIVLLAYQLALLKDRRDLVRFENVIQPTAHTAFMVGLIVVISGDAGSALVYLFIFICMVFAAGMAKRWLALGLGGGAVLIIYLTLFTDTPQLEAQGINLLFFIPIAAAAVTVYAVKKQIKWKMTLKITLWGLIGVIIGMYFARILGGELTAKVFGGLLVIIGISEIFTKSEKRVAKRKNGCYNKKE